MLPIQELLEDFTNWIEQRYGRTAAWIATIVGIIGTIGILVGILFALFN